MGRGLVGTIIAGLLLIGVVGGFGSVGYIYRDQINAFLIQFSTFIEGYGPAGYALFVAVYAGLEVLAIPAIPLTMSAGLLFGSLTGTILVSISGTVAASVAFLIARYFARDRILKMVEGNKKFLAIDKAIGENGFRVVTLLRLSPLLPFSLGNYLYGLTSVKFVPYVLGSWLGMLPGTWAYVSAGAFGRAIIVLAIPAIPLTMSAGLLFGSLTGTILVSISGTVAASVAFLIARYFARDRILKMVEGNKKFLAIDKAIGENGFRVVTLLRLSPLLPFSLGNYLYGLTSVKFVPYVLGSWLGMLPGTWAYVSAGAFGRAIIQEESQLGLAGGTNQLLTLGVGLLATALAATYVTRLAKDAMKDIE
ncbi:hypothetical protein CTI12_AA164090 [Artemisia annua]|uniref:VTT domain-containing protein n=1 Tax=Artemisia annua TaxID=35608 RepID=A0A2U1PCZ4_ARTAN|nr:hypothetical protein CTI12_AA164090 [Artemisia annua]